MSMLKGFRIVSKHLKGESGRSMIEMLATLVIVGILSISALWGYRYAIEVHKENETVDWVVKSIVGARTGFITDKYGERAEEDGSVRVPIKEVISGVTYLSPEDDDVIYGFTTPTQAKVSVDVIDQKTFEVYVDEMTWNVCRKLLRANLEYTSAKLVKEETPRFVYTTSSSDEINDFCEIVDPAKRRPSQPVSNDPNVEQGVSFVLCFGDDCQGGCPPNKRLCPADLQCCSACTEDGKCANNEKGCPVNTPYECTDGCCDERCPYHVLNQSGAYCECPDGTYLCGNVCIPNDRVCCDEQVCPPGDTCSSDDAGPCCSSLCGLNGNGGSGVGCGEDGASCGTSPAGVPMVCQGGFCILATLKECSLSTDCPGGYLCGSSGTCEPEETDPPEETTALPPGDEGDACGNGAGCASCKAGLVCSGATFGQCNGTCKKDDEPGCDPDGQHPECGVTCLEAQTCSAQQGKTCGTCVCDENDPQFQACKGSRESCPDIVYYPDPDNPCICYCGDCGYSSGTCMGSCPGGDICMPCGGELCACCKPGEECMKLEPKEGGK